MNSDFKIEKVKSKKCIQEEDRKATPIFEIELLYFNSSQRFPAILSFDPTAFTTTKLNFLWKTKRRLLKRKL